jgi:hypothetical protein
MNGFMTPAESANRMDISPRGNQTRQQGCQLSPAKHSNPSFGSKCFTCLAPDHYGYNDAQNPKEKENRYIMYGMS